MSSLVQLYSRKVGELENKIERLEKVKKVTDTSFRELLSLCGKYEKALDDIEKVLKTSSYSPELEAISDIILKNKHFFN